MDRAIAFLKDVRTELSKVNWPTRNQTVQYTLVVIGLSLVLAVFLGGLDLAFQWGLNKFIIK